MRAGPARRPSSCRPGPAPGNGAATPRPCGTALAGRVRRAAAARAGARRTRSTSRGCSGRPGRPAPPRAPAPARRVLRRSGPFAGRASIRRRSVRRRSRAPARARDGQRRGRRRCRPARAWPAPIGRARGLRSRLRRPACGLHPTAGLRPGGASRCGRRRAPSACARCPGRRWRARRARSSRRRAPRR